MPSVIVTIVLLIFRLATPIVSDTVPAMLSVALLVIAPSARVERLRVGPVTSMLAIQLAAAPPLVPVHVQLQGPVPVIADAVPFVQRLVVGAIVKALLLLMPQVPLTGAIIYVCDPTALLLPAAS